MAPLIDNKWGGGIVDLKLPPLPPYLKGRTGGRFDAWVLDPAVGEEVCLTLLEEPEYARSIGEQSPISLHLKSGVVRTSVGCVAFLLWQVQTPSGETSYYEHPLNAFNEDALKLLLQVGRQAYLKMIVLDCISGDTAAFIEFKNDYKLGDFARFLPSVLANEAAPDFAEVQSALQQEFSVEELIEATV